MSPRRLKKCCGVVAILLFALSVTPVEGGYTATGFNSKSGNKIAAETTFGWSGNATSGLLTVTLTNTGTYKLDTSGQQVIVPTDVLTALFFNYTGSGTIDWNGNKKHAEKTRPVGTSATTKDWANYTYAGTTLNVAGEWAYQKGTNLGSTGYQYGISSSGYGVFGSSDRLGPGNLTDPVAPDGLQWGIVGATYVNGSGNGGVESTPLARGSVTFTFATSGGVFDLTRISGVRFQFGTNLSEPSLTGTPDGNTSTGGPGTPVPAPAGLVLLVSATPFALLLRRRRRQPTAA